MRMIVTTPLSVIADAENVRIVRAEDETGAFGILPGHADFLTVLGVSVVSWSNGAGKEHHIAVSSGILSVKHGELVEIAAHEAFAEDTLSTLGSTVEDQFRRQSAEEQEARTAATRLQFATIRSIEKYISVGRGKLMAGRSAAGDDGKSRLPEYGDGE